MILPVLPADVDDRADSWDEAAYAASLAGNFGDGRVGARQQLPSVSRPDDPADLRRSQAGLADGFFEQFRSEPGLIGDLIGVAGCDRVVVAGLHQHDLHGPGTSVDAAADHRTPAFPPARELTVSSMASMRTASRAESEGE